MAPRYGSARQDNDVPGLKFRRNRPVRVCLYRFALILALLLPIPITVQESHALTSAAITIDGDMSDWEGVFLDPDNVVLDTIIPEDPDNPGQGDRDLDIAATTWDPENLYLFWRRTSAGSRAVTMFAYIDLDGDGVMRSTDAVVIMTFGNSGYQSNANASNVVYYTPANPAGDPMLGDGHTMAGSAQANQNRVPGAQYAGAKDDAGLRFEGSVDWASLGIPAGSPISIQFAAGNGTQSPTHIQDNAGPGGGLSFARTGVELTPATSSTGAAAGSIVTHSYTLTNTGNASDTFSLTTASAAGWGGRILVGGVPVDSVTLAPGASTTVYVEVTIPPDAPQGAVDTTTLRATSSTDPGTHATATARTAVGAVTVTPDRTASMHPGGTVTYVHTVSNNTGAGATFDLTATSSAGWTTELFAADGITPVSSITLAEGASADIVVRVHVPAGAALGTQDVTTVRARLTGQPTVTAVARDTTTARAELTIAPNRESVGGRGTAVSYQHRVTNNSAEQRTISLSAISSLGWTTGLYAADGVTPISSVTLAPYGGFADVIVRVHIPAGAADTAVDITTAQASFGATSSQVTDTTRVRSLATYDSPGFGHVATEFVPGETVYARGMGLAGYSQVRFRWIDSTGTLVHQSSPVDVDALGMAFNPHTLAPNAALGEWTLVLVDASNNAEITRSNFTVTPDARITELGASDAPGVGQSVQISSQVVNDGASAITGSTMSYVIWWDADGDGVFGAGDLYIDQDGQSQVWDGTSPVSTRVTTGIDVTAGGTWSEPEPWEISNSGFPNQGTYRVTATWTTVGGSVIDVKTTEFYSIPALGWPLFLLTAIAGATLLWKKRDRFAWPAEEVAP